MKIEIIKIGKCKHAGVEELTHEYFKRLKPLASVESILWKESESEMKIPKLFGSQTLVIALDERGKQWTSQELASQLRSWQENPSIKKCTFVIGGPYGLPPELRAQVQHTWSLSAGTLPSDFAWLVVCEQIYRAFTILKGMSYHHD
ncbi:23S rRNA (pseudouridine(1915)-N(3))-methyltransferase RlmH [bacterium]|nr:23S rRNA (pseudouridine(1915)-N(3))-methyltransferase RlmH [bacterium]